MNEINFGNVALFYSAEDMLQPDADYRGVSEKFRATEFAIERIRAYFEKVNFDSRDRKELVKPRLETIVDI